MAKTYKCKYCKNEIEEKNVCPKCGRIVNELNPVMTVCSSTSSFAWNLDGKLTERFFILRKTGFMETFFDTLAINLPIIGALISILLFGLFRLLKKNTYGFYDLKEIRKVIYPFYTKRTKKPFAMRVEMKNGKDFVLILDVKRAPAVAEQLASLGVYIENGEGQNFDKTYCNDPLFKPKEIKKQVCAEAAKFVKMSRSQTAMPPMTGVSDL